MTFEQIDSILKKEKITPTEGMDIFTFLYTLFNKHTGESEAINQRAVKLKEKADQSDIYVDKLDKALYDMIVVRSYTPTQYIWRGKKYAYEAYDLLEEFNKTTSYERKDQMGSIYLELGEYFNDVCLRKKALDCYKRAFDFAIDANLKYEIIYDSIVAANRLEIPPTFTKEMITKEFPDKDNTRLFNLLDKEGYLKSDPVENTHEFQEVYDKVNEAAYKRVQEEGGLKVCFQLWMILKEEYKKCGITWKDPGIMNPKTRFE